MGNETRVVLIGHDHNIGFYCRYNDETEDKNVQLIDVTANAERFARYSYVAQHIKWLQKDVLTQLEASIENERQFVALRALLKVLFSQKLDWIYEQMKASEAEQTHLASEIL